MNYKPTLFLISAERANLSLGENVDRTEKLEQLLNQFNLHYQIVFGVYEGGSEDAFLIKSTDYNKDLNRLLEFAQQFDQDSILEISQEQHGWLHFTDSRSESYLGMLSDDVNLDTPNYTDLLNGFAFTFKKEA